MKTLTTTEAELLQIVETSKDPAKAMMLFIDIAQRIISGEDPESIRTGYGAARER